MEGLTTGEIIIAVIMGVLSIVFLCIYIIPAIKIPFIVLKEVVKDNKKKTKFK